MDCCQQQENNWDTTKRDAFVAAADKDIAKGKVALTSLEKKAETASASAKSAIEADTAALQLDLKAAEAKLSEMKKAGAMHWREFEAAVSAATAKLRKSTDKVIG